MKHFKTIIATTFFPLLLNASYYEYQLNNIEKCISKNIPQMINQLNEEKSFLYLISNTNNLLNIKCEKELKTTKNKLIMSIKFQYGTDSEKNQAKENLTFEEQEEIEKIKKEKEIYFSNRMARWQTNLLINNSISKELGKYNNKIKINIKNSDNEIKALINCLKDNKKVIKFLTKNRKHYRKHVDSLIKISSKFCKSTVNEYSQQWFLSNQSTLSYLLNNKEPLNDEETKELKKYFLANLIFYSIQ